MRAGTNKHAATVVLIGGYPPPNGGVTVHIRRLAEACAGHGMKVVVCSQFRQGTGVPPHSANVTVVHGAFACLRQILKLIWRRVVVLHYHVNEASTLVYLTPWAGLLAKWWPAVVTIHGGAFPALYGSESYLRKAAIGHLLRSCAKCVAVSHAIGDALVRDWAIAPRKVSVIPAFLDVNLTGANAEPPKGFATFRAGYKQLIVTSGYFDRPWGFHLVAAVAKALESLNIGVVLVSYGPVNQTYRAEVQVGLTGNCLALSDLEPDAFIAVLREADLYLRASAYDGDCVAIREALYLGKTVVASDAATRPAECILFDSGNPEDMLSKIRLALDHPAKCSRMARAANADDLIDLYVELTTQPHTEGD